jgi:beta-N-acetylhexosaminidase
VREAREVIGQLLIIGFDGAEMSARLSLLLQRIQPAGVILFGRNIASAEQTFKLLKDCQAQVEAPLFRCVDLEGGKVDRLRDVIGPAPSPAEVFATGDRKLFRQHGRMIGENCRTLGFNVDFAPTVDLALEASRSVMSSRAVSADPQETVDYAREFLGGLRDAGVLGCGKHFPGLGEGQLDSHHELPVIDKAWKKLWAEDLVPYRTLPGHFPFVMVSHAAYPDVTKDQTPASLSKKWISDILRKKIGYTGLIASDDLEMGGVLAAAPIEQAAVSHIRAGGDLCLICHEEEFVTRSYVELIRDAERDSRFRRRVAEAAARVQRLKRKLFASIHWRTPPSPTQIKVQKLSRQLWEFSEQVRLQTIDRQEAE